jgi:hypothetical protein
MPSAATLELGRRVVRDRKGRLLSAPRSHTLTFGSAILLSQVAVPTIEADIPHDT